MPQSRGYIRRMARDQLSAPSKFCETGHLPQREAQFCTRYALPSCKRHRRERRACERHLDCATRSVRCGTVLELDRTPKHLEICFAVVAAARKR
eukprot:6194353-Pleurochrysis_carterae.AAC.2